MGNLFLSHFLFFATALLSSLIYESKRGAKCGISKDIRK